MITQIGTNLRIALELLQQDQVVGIPTETVYGLAGNALSSKALLRIFEVKNRPHFNPLIAHTNSLEKASSFLEHIPRLAYRLADAFWPGPLTLLLPRSSDTPDLLTAGSSLVAVRVPKHTMTLELLSELDFPLAAPSANPFGYISPTTAAHVHAQLGGKIPYILDGGPSPVGIESTILGIGNEGHIQVYRVGGLSLERIEEVTGKIDKEAIPLHERPQSPGMLKSHYAPTTPLYVGEMGELIDKFGKKGSAILAFRSPVDGIIPAHQCILSQEGELGTAASHLFASMRYLDTLGVERILAEPVPNHGLGRAINDRLHRAQEEMKI